MIYAIRALGTNLIKFGKAKNPQDRICTLQTGCPVDLALIAIADWPDVEERRAHIYLDSEHSRGEWFRDGDKARRLIDCMMDTHTGLQRWHNLKMKNGVQSRLEPLEASGTTSNLEIHVVPSGQHKRLGRVLEYAKEMQWQA